MGNPVVLSDSMGSSFKSNWHFFWDWICGRGPKNRYYESHTIETQELMMAPGADKMRQKFRENNYQATTVEYKSWAAYLGTFYRPESTAAQVGGFIGTIQPLGEINGERKAIFKVVNTADRHSFFVHAYKFPPKKSGIMRDIYQEFWWIESY